MASHVRPLLSLVGLVAAEQISFHEPVPEPLTLKVFRMMGVSASPDAPGYFQIAAHLEGGSATPSAMDGLQVLFLSVPYAPPAASVLLLPAL